MGVDFEVPALNLVFQATQGFPYFVQEWGYQSWNLASTSPITEAVVEEAGPRVVQRLDQSFFRVRLTGSHHERSSS